MATKPTRQQQQACDQFAEALLLIASGARLDGKGTFDRGDLDEIARRLARASGAFDLDEIAARALERRARALALPGDAVELLTLMEAEVRPLELLSLSDEAFRERVGTLREELGEV